MGVKQGLSGGIGRHSGLKIRRFVHSGRTGSIPVSGTTKPRLFLGYFISQLQTHLHLPAVALHSSHVIEFPTL